MIEYKCPRCSYETNRKSSMNKHLNRKKICFLVEKDVDPRLMKDSIFEDRSNNKKLKILKKKINTLKEKINFEEENVDKSKG